MRHPLSKAQMWKGLRKAIRTQNKRRSGPKHLLPSMGRHEERLTTEVRADGRRDAKGARHD
jgi:hypothetical protein